MLIQVVDVVEMEEKVGSELCVCSQASAECETLPQVTSPHSLATSLDHSHPIDSTAVVG
jgi:hypothetical protein